MPKIQYITRRFQDKRQTIVDQANIIIKEYQKQDLDITLRQLYYQFVARNLMTNTLQQYGLLSATVSDARLAGQVDWNAIVDRTRRTVENTHWDSPNQIIDAAAATYKIDTRDTQLNYIEVWVEKEALAGVIERTCKRLDVLSFACRGYVSQSAMWRAAQRLLNKIEERKNAIILHLGDHDPSGINMTEDIKNRLNLFCSPDQVKIKRIALTMEQVKKYSPPPNPAKQTDPRCKNYSLLYGDKSWELDALEPSILDTLITKNINNLTDKSKLKALQERQEEEKEELQEIANNL